ncbi:hypothetical protein GCM10009612_08730 [Streptomyces beijiangensis]
MGGKTYAGEYASTDNSERTRLGDTDFHNGPIGLSAQTTDGADMGFIREPGGTLNSMTAGGKAYYYLTDALGSVIGLTDEAGTKVNTYAYSPRGVSRAATSEQITQPYRFAGGQQDPTGIYHLGARYYDPNIGRFTQPDPSGQEANPYLYAEDDPVNRIDPSGLWGWGEVLGGMLGTAIGITVTVITGNPYLGFALGGCIGGMTSEAYYGGHGKDLAEACAGGAVFGGIGGVAQARSSAESAEGSNALQAECARIPSEHPRPPDKGTEKWRQHRLVRSYSC